MDRRYVILFLVAILLVLGIGLWFSKSDRPASQGPGAQGTESPTKGAVPAGTVVPEIGGQAPSGVAVPETVIPAAANVSAKYRVFDLTFGKGTIVPNSVSVYVGDTVQLNVRSMDQEYDFTQPDLGFGRPYTIVPPMGSRLIQFSPVSPGKYLFYCASCGGPAKGPTGYIYVVPVKQ